MTSQPVIAGAFRGALGGFQLDAEFQVPATGVTALSGPSASGKTTLLRCMAGLTRLPGAMTVNGNVWQDERVFVPPHRRPIGFVFQEPSLLSHLSVRDNLMFGARRTSRPARIGFEEVSNLLGLDPLLARSTLKLSGGERQRVSLGRALLTQPQLLLMDEPLSSLDIDSKAEILPYLERLKGALRIPILYVSHDPAEIERLADRILVMGEGRLAKAASVPVRARIDLGPGPSAGAGPGLTIEAARRRLDQMDPQDRDRFALAALKAGLEPAGPGVSPQTETG